MSNEFFNFDYHYKIYLDKCIELAQSIVVKSDYMAYAMNDIAISKNATVIEHDKTTWKYYKNICGEYHYLDKIMRVVSVDTLEEIDFTKETLKQHRATKKAYSYGTLLYQELLARYPDQEMLILGILYPTDMDKAVNSSDGTILSYPNHLIEKNEYTFIDNLQEWINGYKLRREGPVYGFSDKLWPISNLGIFYLNLLPAIITIRKSKCKTNEAHSYHVRSYLKSHGFIDEYLDAMTLKQSLRFYMNINWVERNIGKKETQRWLIHEAMTVRNLPISEYNFKHDSLRQPDDIYPTNFFQKKSLNNLEKVTDIDDLTLHQLLLKEDPLARENPITRVDHEERIKRQLENSLSNTLKTKVLESKVTDYSDAEVEKLSKSLFNIWADWSSRGYFRSIVYFTDAVNGERLQLRAIDALILYIYVYYKAYGIEFNKIPDLKVEAVPIIGDVSFKDIKDMGEHVLTKTTKGIIEFNKVEDSFINKILDSRVRPRPVVSISEFYDSVKEINIAFNQQLQWAFDENDYLLRGYKEAMVYRMYSDHWVELHSKENNQAKLYSLWLNEQNIDLSKYEKNDYLRLAKNILFSATGVDLQTTKSIRSVHRAMLNLLKQLSSYSVQFIRETNESDLFIVDFIPPTLTKPNSTGVELQYYENIPPKILDYKGYGSKEVDGSNIVLDTGKVIIDQTGGEEIISPPLSDVEISAIPVTHEFLELELHAWYHSPDFDNPDDLVNIPGMESFNNLSLEDKLKIKDVYGHDFRYFDPCKLNRSIVISTPGSGFKYHTQIEVKLGRGYGFKYHTKL